jgi:hypothetical protein
MHMSILFGWADDGPNSGCTQILGVWFARFDQLRRVTKLQSVITPPTTKLCLKTPRDFK